MLFTHKYCCFNQHLLQTSKDLLGPSTSVFYIITILYCYILILYLHSTTAPLKVLIPWFRQEATITPGPRNLVRSGHFCCGTSFLEAICGFSCSAIFSQSQDFLTCLDFCFERILRYFKRSSEMIWRNPDQLLYADRDQHILHIA